ncbi:MAG: hypothetical protein ACMG6S_30305 [Byssovorax sp.]
MSNIIDKALEVIAGIRNRGANEWITETIGERFGVRYTDDTHTDALLDEGWKSRTEAAARCKELRAGGAVDVRLVKITTRWRRRPRKAVEKVEKGEKVELLPLASEPVEAK